MFLTDAQLARLTGLTRPSAQARWLEANEWRFTIAADGSVVVHELEAQRKLCGGSVGRRAARVEPDIEALQ